MKPILDKSIYEPIDKKKDGIRILTMRYPPNPNKIDHNADYDWYWLDPPGILLQLWDLGKITWEEFTRRYIQHIKNSTEAQESIRQKREWNKNPQLNITLLCCESSKNPYCHRYILKYLINNEDEKQLMVMKEEESKK